MLIHWYTKSCFLLSQIDTKNHLLYCTCTKSCIHRSPTCLSFLLSKMQFYENATTKKGLESIWRKDLLQIVQKTSLWKSYDAHSERTCSADSLQAPELVHSCDPSWPAEFHLEGGHLPPFTESHAPLALPCANAHRGGFPPHHFSEHHFCAP